MAAWIYIVYKDKIDELKLSKIIVPSLDARALMTSFKEFPSIRRAYANVLGMHNIDHFSINVVLGNGKMLVFSIRPEIAYTLYSSRRGVEQDLAISPTFYNNLDFYFWDDCYKEDSKRELMSKKEEKFGIKAGAVIVKNIDDVKYLLSFGTRTSEDNFRTDIIHNQSLYESIGLGCLEYMGSSINKYLCSEELGNVKSKIYKFVK
jgi:hypothetical protein